MAIQMSPSFCFSEAIAKEWAFSLFLGTNNPSFISVIQEKATLNVPLLLCDVFFF